MSTKALSCPLNTGDITVMSHTNSLTVTGKRITRLGSVEVQGQVCPSTVHLNLEIAPSAAGEEDEIGLIFQPEDAVKLGLSLVVMGLGDSNSQQLEATIHNLRQLQADVAAGHCSQ